MHSRAFFTREYLFSGNKAWTTKVLLVDTATPMSPASRARKWFVVAALFLVFPALLPAQPGVAPQNGEYSISGPLNGDQVASRVAVGSDGGFVVGQDNGIDGNGLGIVARRLSADFSPVGNAIRVNEVTAGDQERPAIALLPSGGAVAAWQGGKQGFQNIFARFLNTDGSFATPDIAVNSAAKSYATRVSTNWLVFRNNRPVYRTQRIKRIVNQKQERSGGAAVAVLPDGTVVVAYTSGRSVHEKAQTLVHRTRFINSRFITNSVLQFVESDTDGMQDIYFQLFLPSGQKIGSEVRANQNIYLNQNRPAIAALADGTFVVAWNSDEQSAVNTIDVVARRFDGLGNPLGNEFFVNAPSQSGGAPAIAGHTDGGFTVTWAQKSAQRTNGLDIVARTFNAAAVPLGGAFVVNTHTYGDQFSPAIAATAGGQLIVWTSMAQDGSREGVYGRALNNGAVAGDEFRANTTTYLRQFQPHVAAHRGSFLVVWSSYQTLAGFDLFGQRYALP